MIDRPAPPQLGVEPCACGRHLARPAGGRRILPLALTVTPNGARNFDNTFGVDALGAGDLVATAGVDIEVVPVPAALPLLATAVGGLGFALHRRRRAAA